MKKLILPLALLVGISIGCKTEEPFVMPRFVASVGPGIFLEKTLVEKRQACLEELIKNDPHVADIVVYHESNRQRFYNVLEKQFEIGESEAEDFWDRLKIVDSQAVALTIMPNRLLGKKRKSPIIVFSHFYEFALTKEDKQNCVTHERSHAKYNFLGFKYEGKNIRPEHIGSRNYGIIMEFFALSDQLEEIYDGLKVSKKIQDIFEKAYARIYDKFRLRMLNEDKFAGYILDSVAFEVSRDIKTKKPLLSRN